MSKYFFVVLEGGYNLESLACSSEAVVKMLQIKKENNESVDGLIKELSEGQYESIEQMRIAAQVAPREAFKQMASKVAGKVVKKWPML